MPCPHMEINIVKRAEGQSAVNAAAYQTGEKLYSERDRKYMYNGTKEDHFGVFAVYSGNRYLIIRSKFEEYLQQTSSI